MKKNIPYVKQFNELGEVTNPITPSNPYLSPYPNGNKEELNINTLTI